MSHYVDEGFKGFTAGANLSAYTAVKLNGSGQVIPAAAAADVIIGVVHKDVASGRSVDVRLRSAAGTSNIKCGGTVAAGARVTSDAAGAAVTATTGNEVIGIALEAGVAGQVIEIMPQGAKA